MREPQKRSDEARVIDPSPPSPSSSSSPSLSDENEELQRLENAPPFWRSKTSKRLSKQMSCLSMCELPRDIAWERRRRQFLQQERRKNGINKEADNLTDEDLHELKGCIELGFGFNEENGQRLCTTLPALDLYFAVNRQFVTSPLSSPASNASAPSIACTSSASTPSVTGLGTRSASFGNDLESWKICSRGDDPQHVKTKLRHWALAVACSVKQSS
ncbi:1-phosphatidylinositol-4 [Perilla frutescens var. hirtella]|uniref:1-phosphatidylinositol-4 n=1 Tax=Perilla frutescens var. hirtella TaxID=608512 RepID=A0AAD4PAC6_PERFH|nr:1-phosphatidylinositol-4 [Perilla frutescens var. hirtella]KAH6804203.1 1-phosphatidylinositol-4 [Perilla frutescens var. frutescens]KAH6831582.1 1-phosphatidylinositol-4 [Perilla frutescens var. hirtella]